MFDDEFNEDDAAPQKLALTSEPSNSDKYSGANLDSFNEKLKNEAIQKLKLVLYLRQKLTCGWTQKNLEPLIDQYGKDDQTFIAPNWRSIVRWHKTLEKNNDNPVSLIPKQHLKGNRSRRTSGNSEQIFIEAVNQFLDSKRPNVSSAYRFYKDKCLLNSTCSQPINIMSQRAFYLRISKLKNYDVILKRYGKFQADMRFGFKGTTIRPERVMQRVEIDHTPLDLVLIDDETGTPIGRPNLTLVKDIHSGCIVGYYLSFEAPNFVCVSKALSNAMLPKTQSFEKWGINWKCYGKIEVLVVDNGAEFWSSSLEHACLELGIHVQYNPTRSPWLKPFVERHFRIINDTLLTDVHGKTFSNISERGDYNALKNAKVTFGQFVWAFEKWIAEVYNQAANSLGTAVPAIRWQESCEKLPPVSLTQEEIERLPQIMGYKEQRTLTASGITFEYLRYDSEELSEYRKSLEYGEQDFKVMIKIDFDNLSYIFVYLPNLEKYLSVPCVDQVYSNGLTYTQHRVNIKFNKCKVKMNGKSDSDLAKSRQEIREILNGEKGRNNKKTSTNKKVARYNNQSSESVRNKKQTEINVSSQSDKSERTAISLVEEWNSMNDKPLS